MQPPSGAPGAGPGARETVRRHRGRWRSAAPEWRGAARSVPRACRRSAKAPVKRCRRSRADRSTSICAVTLGQHGAADVGKLLLQRIVHEHRQHVVVRGDLRHQPHRLGIGARLVGDQADQPVVVGEQRRAAERLVEQRWVGWRAVRRQTSVLANHLGQDVPYRRVARLGADLDHAPLGEDDGADAVAQRGHAEGGQRRGLGGGHRLHGAPAAEEHRHALVDQQQHAAVALLGVDADMRAAASGGRRPVDGARVVALEIVPQLLEIEAAAAQARGVAAGQQRMHRLARQEAEALGAVAQAQQVVEGDVGAAHVFGPPASSRPQEHEPAGCRRSGRA